MDSTGLWGGQQSIDLNMRDEPYHDLPGVQYELSRDLLNVQDEPYRDLPSVQYHDRPLVMFGQNITPCAGTCVQSRQVLLADLVHFTQYPVMQILNPLSQYVSHCWLLLKGHLVPLLHQLVRFLSNVYAVFEHAYIFPVNQHHAAFLVRIELMLFFNALMISQPFRGGWVEDCCVLLVLCYIIFLGADFHICAPQLHV
jgi:hypothetical protein